MRRVMALGDSHGNTKFMVAALNIAHQENCDVVHVVGDFGIWTHVEAGVRFLDAVDEEARSLGILVTFTCGNHENYDHLYAIPVDDDGWRRVRPHIWHAPRGHIWRWENMNFLSMGGAHSINGPAGAHWWTQDIGPLDKGKTVTVQDENGFRENVHIPKGTDLGDWWPQETITDEEVQTAIQNMVEWADGLNPYQEIDVMFSHDAPTSVSLPVTSYPAAEKNRAKLQQVYEVAQPQLLVHGHYHQFQQFHDIRNDCLAVCLAHDQSKSGQFMFINTDTFETVVPTWKR